MNLIKNFEELAKTPERKIVLEIIEAGFSAIQPQRIVKKSISLQQDVLTIQDKTFNLKDFNRIFLIGFGKGSAAISLQLEKLFSGFLTEGYVTDVESQQFSKIKYSIGTHPLPSEQNLSFTKNAIERIKNLTLSENDLILVVINGGGSVLFELPFKIPLEKLIEVNKALLQSGATIGKMNIIRKHLSVVKGGSLAKLLYPATVVALISSDVPGNDLSTIASGPTVKDETSVQDALSILEKYNLVESLSISQDDFVETPKEGHYFEKVTNIILLSNQTALSKMQSKALSLGWQTTILSDSIQGEAGEIGKNLIDKTESGTILLAGGETTVTVGETHGAGGRNQEVVLGALPYLSEERIICSVDSDGWDNIQHAGAIGDFLTAKIARDLKLDPTLYLNENNSYEFFKRVGDGIVTGRLPSNVSDLMVVLKK